MCGGSGIAGESGGGTPAHEEAGGLLEPGASRQVTLDQPQMLERPGAMVGPYKLMEEIGEEGSELCSLPNNSSRCVAR